MLTKENAHPQSLEPIHSAARPYGTQGSFAKESAQRTMQIITSKEAEKTHLHPLVRTHPVTGRKALFISPVYTVGVEGLTQPEADGFFSKVKDFLEGLGNRQGSA